MDGGVTANLRRSCGTSAREKSWFGGAELSSAPNAAFNISQWVETRFKAGLGVNRGVSKLAYYCFKTGKVLIGWVFGRLLIGLLIG